MNEPTRNRGRSAAPRVLLVQPDVELRRPVLHRTSFIQAACGANRKDWMWRRQSQGCGIERSHGNGAAAHRSLSLRGPSGSSYKVTEGRQRVSSWGGAALSNLGRSIGSVTVWGAGGGRVPRAK